MTTFRPGDRVIHRDMLAPGNVFTVQDTSWLGGRTQLIKLDDELRGMWLAHKIKRPLLHQIAATAAAMRATAQRMIEEGGIAAKHGGVLEFRAEWVDRITEELRGAQ